MKRTSGTKESIAGQQQKRIKAYYNAYQEGCKIVLMSRTYDINAERYVIVSKKEWNNEYYFVVQGKYAKFLVVKVICNTEVGVAKLPKTSSKYMENKRIYDSWIADAKDKCDRDMRQYYNTCGTKYISVIAEDGAIKNYDYLLKKEFRGGFYFVIRVSLWEYVIAKLIWDGCAHARMLNAVEFDANCEVFEGWIEEAKY